MLIFTIGSVSAIQAADDVQTQGKTPAAQSIANDLTVAFINAQPIKASELDAYAATIQLPREEALDDLIDLRLVRAAATAQHVSAPARSWSAQERAAVELALAKALGLDVPQGRISLIVDHAWVRDAEEEKGRIADRASLERLRVLVKAGATIPDAYAQLQVDGAPWHIGDHEEYPYEVIPAEARDLPPGSLSPIIPGDGGLHLFRIYQHKQELPPSSEIHGLLIERLRRDATIEKVETPDPSVQDNM